jgi:pSer/pThr/pTyr-binding forkhead associated (FHA) protein
MPYIQIQDQEYALGPADLTVGAFDGAAVRLPGDDATAFAVLKTGADGRGVVRRGSANAVVLVNGVQLGAEPSPLIHGDKIGIGGQEFAYGDDQKGGSTQFVSASDIPEHLKAKAGVPKKPTTATGGRLVSLVDGREYTVPGTGVTFGREIGNDIVIASTDVSRKHASIAPADGGYVLSDHSTNGVFVNGTRIEKTQVLGRGDVLKIGPEEFRFYADVAKAGAPLAAATTAPVPPALVEEAKAEARVEAIADLPAAELVDGFADDPTLEFTPTAPPAPVAPPPSTPSVFDLPDLEMPMIELEEAISAAAPIPKLAPKPEPVAPVTPPPAPPTPAVTTSKSPELAALAAFAAAEPGKLLATLEVINEGPLKGHKFEIFSALTNIGRGAHNDVVINDESLSGSHAKILKRDGAWWVVDQNSTNGTYVGGKRISGEQQLTGAPDLRFGGIKVTFRPMADSLEDAGKGTRAIAAVNVDAARKAAAPRPSATAAKPEPAAVPAEKKKGCAAMIAFVLALGAAGATMMVFLLSTRG